MTNLESLPRSLRNYPNTHPYTYTDPTMAIIQNNLSIYAITHHSIDYIPVTLNSINTLLISPVILVPMQDPTALVVSQKRKLLAKDADGLVGQPAEKKHRRSSTIIDRDFDDLLGTQDANIGDLIIEEPVLDVAQTTSMPYSDRALSFVLKPKASTIKKRRAHDEEQSCVIKASKRWKRDGTPPPLPAKAGELDEKAMPTRAALLSIREVEEELLLDDTLLLTAASAKARCAASKGKPGALNMGDVEESAVANSKCHIFGSLRRSTACQDLSDLQEVGAGIEGPSGHRYYGTTGSLADSQPRKLRRVLRQREVLEQTRRKAEHLRRLGGIKHRNLYESHRNDIVEECEAQSMFF